MHFAAIKYFELPIIILRFFYGIHIHPSRFMFKVNSMLCFTWCVVFNPFQLMRFATWKRWEGIGLNILNNRDIIKVPRNWFIPNSDTDRSISILTFESIAAVVVRWMPSTWNIHFYTWKRAVDISYRELTLYYILNKYFPCLQLPCYQHSVLCLFGK